MLNSDALPWVETATHLGHELHQQCTMEYDARCKRANFIEKTTSIRETFNFARPEQKLSAISIYAGGEFMASRCGTCSVRGRSPPSSAGTPP